MPPTEFPAEIASVLLTYSQFLDVRPVRAEDVNQGFSGARVWKISTAEAAFALRQWPPQGLPPVRIRGLHRLLKHLQNCGLPFVSVPLPSATGETLISAGNRLWQLEPWLPGASDFHDHPSEPRLKAAMSALASWHRAAATFAPDDAVREWFGSAASAGSPAVVERLTKLQQWNPTVLGNLRTQIQTPISQVDHELCSELLELIQSRGLAVMSELESLQPARFALQPCLRDIWHDHVLFLGDSVTGLIDPSACRRENVATDLARLIGSLVEDDSHHWQIALEAYRVHRGLSLSEEALVAALSHSEVLLSAVTWLEWLFVERRTFPDPEIVQQRLRSLQRRLRNLPFSSWAGSC